MRRYNLANGSMPTIRVVVLGGHSVGKSDTILVFDFMTWHKTTCPITWHAPSGGKITITVDEQDFGTPTLVVRFLTKRFIGEYVSGTEITYQQEVNLAGNKVTAEICDALIQQDQQSYLKKFSTNTEAYLLVYNVCNRDSFDYACSLAREIKSSHVNSPSGNEVPLLLVGNKSDLDHFREVKSSEGENFAKSMSLCHFTETSAAESYSEVEQAFRLIFRLVRAQFRTSPTPSVSSGRGARKHSFSQVANLIRDHVRRQHTNLNNARANSLERGLSLSRSQSMSCDNNNNSMLEQSSKKRTRKSAITAIQPIHSPSLYSGKPRLSSKCLSLTTLIEKPNKNNDSNLPKESDAEPGLYKNQRYHTIDSDLCSRFACNEMGWQNNEYNGNQPTATKMSLSSDDALDLSDMSTPEEDAFLPDSNSLAAKMAVDSGIVAQNNRENSRRSSINKNEATHRKSSINKMGLQITMTVHSDGEYEEKEQTDPDELPPKSAPILRASSNNKFRFFPNGFADSQDSVKQPWLSVSNTNVPVSPLLDGGRRQRSVKSPKEEKKSPSHNLLKQFFKGALHGSTSSSRGFGSSSSLYNSGISPATSDNSLSSLSTVAECSRNVLSSIDERLSQEESSCECEPIYFRASSSSLSSIVSNEGLSDDATSSSAPSTPRIGKNHDSIVKSRRSSFREAVGDLIRKRKKSNTNDCYKHSKERFL